MTVAPRNVQSAAQGEYGVVPIESIFRVVAVLLAFLYLSAVAGLSYWTGTTSLGIQMSLVALVLVTLWPLLNGRSDWGWFHPVVFCPLFAFGLKILPLTGVFVLGMTHHNALPTWTPDELDRLVAKELWLTALALVCYYAGHLSGLSPPRPKLSFRKPKHLKTILFVVIVLSATLFIVFVSGRGGLLSYLTSWQEIGRRATAEGAGPLLRITRVGSFAALLWLAADRAALINPFFWGAAGMSLAVNFLGAGSRSSVLILLVAGVAVLSVTRGMLRWRTAVAVALSSLVLVGLLGTIRRDSPRAVSEANKTTGEWVRSTIEEMAARETVVSSSYPVLALVPSQLDLLWGSSYLVAVTGFIPRAIWPDKPISVGRLSGDLFFSIRAGRPPGAVAEAYWNFHIPGIVLVHFLFGVFHRWVLLLQRENPHAPAALVVLAMTLVLPMPTGTGLLEWNYSFVSIYALALLLGAFGTKATE